MKEIAKTVLIGVMVGITGLVLKLVEFEGKDFNFWRGALHPEYYVEESQEFMKEVAQIAQIQDSCLSLQEEINLLESYELSRAQVTKYEPKEETLTVVRMSSSWTETPAHIETNISDGNVSAKGKGKKTEKYSVVAFNDGTFLKVTADKMSALRVKDKVVRKTALELKYDNGKYSVEETVTYHPYYK